MGTDAWLLLALVQVIFEEGLAAPGRTSAFLDGLDELAGHVEGFTPAQADITGIPAEDIRRLARDLADAPRAIAYGRVGLCTQEFGGLATWLVYVLNVVTGNLDREGGLMFSTPGSRSAPARGRGGAGCHRALHLVNAVEREPRIKVAFDGQISHLVGDDGLQAVEVKSSPPGSA